MDGKMAPAGVEMKQVRLWKNPRSSGGFGPELHPLVGGGQAVRPAQEGSLQPSCPPSLTPLPQPLTALHASGRKHP